ncbi:MAG: response regulator transcription factor [Chloroflexi bacterium]|nr:response regulator transcription factor [Chloroflexota bacterium]
MPTKIQMLVVDDNLDFRNLLRMALQQAGYTVRVADTGRAALDLCTSDAIDLVLLDALLPDMDGFTVCHELRKRSDVPVVMITALNSAEHIVQGLEIGVDDYIVKPCYWPEVAVRLQAVLRRSVRCAARRPRTTLANVDIALDDAYHEVRVRGALVNLTMTEYQLLRHLMNQPYKPSSKVELSQVVWGYTLPHKTNFIEVSVRRLREKIEVDPAHPQYIRTIPKVGYQFVPQP